MLLILPATGNFSDRSSLSINQNFSSPTSTSVTHNNSAPVLAATTRFHYQNQPVNAVEGHKYCFLPEPYKTYWTELILEVKSTVSYSKESMYKITALF